MVVVVTVVGVGTYLDVVVAMHIVAVVVVDGGERVEGCGLGLWQFVSHMCHRHNIFTK
jgi:hypothetical protein